MIENSSASALGFRRRVLLGFNGSGFRTGFGACRGFVRVQWFRVSDGAWGLGSIGV